MGNAPGVCVSRAVRTWQNELRLDLGTATNTGIQADVDMGGSQRSTPVQKKSRTILEERLRTLNNNLSSAILKSWWQDETYYYYTGRKLRMVSESLSGSRGCKASAYHDKGEKYLYPAPKISIANANKEVILVYKQNIPVLDMKITGAVIK
ncbi:uncharacterized protein PHACADRAFT_187589 [Phanerochaete carnosa HHB-10118-sp]|uniref:Uncharacterized protein n=1 Tax=Phanerochaete carnosa (strain HHB-10118-sp) TaxID=650164 RepID=K5VWJ3_PHACS|nr:uncharacterized protein PHACADRAFT_187589 [Phanerochaete carnosa HHB-10118-sp]EKM50959.1 hypothetical protein PHACADRAFT_187589 [Phanerochaete carnosa HHB-10118-sp]